MSIHDKAYYTPKKELITNMGYLTYLVEQAVNQYVYSVFDRNVGEVKRTPKALRENGYARCSNEVQGSSCSQSGFSMFFRFKVAGLNRSLQVCVGYPKEELPSYVTGISDDNFQLLSIGSWGDSQEILDRVAKSLSEDGLYHLEIEC